MGSTRGVPIQGTVWHCTTTMSDHLGDQQWTECAGLTVAVTVRNRREERPGHGGHRRHPGRRYRGPPDLDSSHASPVTPDPRAPGPHQARARTPAGSPDTTARIVPLIP